LAVVLYYSPKLTSAHPAQYTAISTLWKRHYQTDLTHDFFERFPPPKYGPVVYSEVETRWCIETRRYLISELDRSQRESLGIQNKEASPRKAKRAKDGKHAAKERGAKERGAKERGADTESESNVDDGLVARPIDQVLEKKTRKRRR
jgi:hypothetical protein